MLAHKYYFGIVLWIFMLLASGLAKNIAGLVVDRRTGQRLAGANIYLENTGIGTSSDKKGAFILEIPDTLSGTYTVIVSYVSYNNFKRKLTFPLEKNRYFRVGLKESLLYLDQIVVTGTRTERLLKDTPVTTQVIKGDVLVESGASDVSEIIDEVTGISVEHHDRFGSNLDLQGFDSNHILFMVDGMKIIGRLNGQMDLSQLSVNDIERIEIVKGASSALYGNQAMGGVVNIITKEADKKPHLNALVKGGSHGLLDSYLSVDAPWRGWASKWNFGRRYYGGYDLDPSTSMEDGRHQEKYDAGMEVKGSLVQHVFLKLRTDYFQEKQGRVLNDFFEERTHNRRFTAAGQLRIDSLLPVSLTLNSEFTRYEHAYGEVVRSSGYFKKSDPTNDGLLKNELLLFRKIGSHRLNVGYSLEQESIESRRVLDENRHSLLHNLYIQDEYKPLKAITLLAGGRYDLHSIYGSQFSPKIALMWSPYSTGRVRVSYGRGFRAPSFKELYLLLTVQDVNLTVKGNPDLRPEHSNSYNLDYEFWNEDNYHGRISFFFNAVKDLINDIRIDDGNPGLNYTYHNFDWVKTWGLEWDMKYFPRDWLDISLGYSYLDSRVKSTGRPLGGKFKHKAHAALIFSLPYHIKLNIRARYFGKRYDTLIDDNSGRIIERIPISDYTVWNANFSIKMPYHLKLSVGGFNLTNYVNKTWGPMPGREWYAGLSYSL